MENYPQITVKPGRCGGRPCIRGYHLTVEHILAHLAEGSTREDLFAEWTFLTDEDIDAAIDFGSHRTGESQLLSCGDFDFVN